MFLYTNGQPLHVSTYIRSACASRNRKCHDTHVVHAYCTILYVWQEMNGRKLFPFCPPSVSPCSLFFHLSCDSPIIVAHFLSLSDSYGLFTPCVRAARAGQELFFEVGNRAGVHHTTGRYTNPHTCLLLRARLLFACMHERCGNKLPCHRASN